MHNTGSLPVQRARREGIGRDAGCAALRWMICKKNTIIYKVTPPIWWRTPRSPLALVRSELPATAAVERQDLLVVLARGRLVGDGEERDAQRGAGLVELVHDVVAHLGLYPIVTLEK